MMKKVFNSLKTYYYRKRIKHLKTDLSYLSALDFYLERFMDERECLLECAEKGNIPHEEYESFLKDVEKDAFTNFLNRIYKESRNKIVNDNKNKELHIREMFYKARRYNNIFSQDEDMKEYFKKEIDKKENTIDDYLKNPLKAEAEWFLERSDRTLDTKSKRFYEIHARRSARRGGFSLDDIVSK